MRAVLINPHARTIWEIDLPDANDNAKGEAMLAALTADFRSPVRAFDRVQLTAADDLWVDDEGLYATNNPVFYWDDDPIKRPLVGMGLILGFDQDGDSVAAKISIADVRKHIQWSDDGVQDGGEMEIGSRHLSSGVG
jgi:hypothetical protein